MLRVPWTLHFFFALRKSETYEDPLHAESRRRWHRLGKIFGSADLGGLIGHRRGFQWRLSRRKWNCDLTISYWGSSKFSGFWNSESLESPTILTMVLSCEPKQVLPNSLLLSNDVSEMFYAEVERSGSVVFGLPRDPLAVEVLFWGLSFPSERAGMAQEWNTIQIFIRCLCDGCSTTLLAVVLMIPAAEPQ